MDRKVIYWVLGVAFVITLALRLFIAFQSPYFSDDSAYFHLRQIENIKDTGVPLFNDPLSYGGRTHIFLPLFDYILAFFSFIFPLVYVAKIIPNVFASSIIFVVYSVVSKLIRKNDIAMYCALISSFIPIYFVNTVNSISVYSLAVPLFFLVVYYFLRLKDIDNSRAYLVLFIFLVLLSPSIIILIMAMIAYYIIMKTESLKLERAESEIIIFSVFLALWFYFLVYKKAFLMHSYSIVWQNMPVQVLSEFFYQISILEAIYLIGVFPFICGVYVVYLHLFRRKAKQIYFFISLVIVLALLIWFKLLQIDLGLVLLGVCFVVLFSKAWLLFDGFIEKTRMHNYRAYVFLVVFLVVFTTSFIPTISYGLEEARDTFSEDEVNAFNLLREMDSGGVVTNVNEGNIVAYFSGKSNIMDEDFVLVPDASQRLEDINNLYSTHSKIIAVRIMDKYNASYIYLSEDSMNNYGITDLPSADEDCISLVYTSGVKIYKNRCKI